MRQQVFLKTIKERRRNTVQLWLFHHNHTLEGMVDSTGFNVCTNGYVGIETWTTAGINAVESMVEEIIKALMDSIRLVHEDSVTFCGWVADSCYCIDLKYKIEKWSKCPFQNLKNKRYKWRKLPSSYIHHTKYRSQISPSSVFIVHYSKQCASSQVYDFEAM